MTPLARLRYPVIGLVTSECVRFDRCDAALKAA